MHPAWHVWINGMSEKKNRGGFKTVFGGGYQRDDVNAYIETMQAQFYSIEQTLKNTINHQRAELDALRAQTDGAEELREEAEELRLALAADEQTLAETQTALEQSRAACIAAEAGRATAEAALACCREELAAAQNALDALRAELDTAKAAATAAEAAAKAEAKAAAEAETAAAAAEAGADIPPAEEPEEAAVPTAEYEALKLKAEQYDRMSAHIGAIMLKANAGAEDVLNRARADADAWLAEINHSLDETRTRAQDTADRLIGDVGRSLAEISRGCRDEIVVDLEELRSALRTLQNTLDAKYADINRKLDFTKDEMEQTASAIIRSATMPAVLPDEK